MGGKGSGRKPKPKATENMAPKRARMAQNKTLPVTAPSVKDKTEGLKEKPKNSTQEKIDKLRFIRIYDLRLIPKYLFLQVKPYNFDLGEIYAMAPNLGNDPFTLLYALADEEHKIKGFLWAEFNTVLHVIDVHLLTVDKEYQDRGRIIFKAIDFLNPLIKKTGYKFRIVTNRPKAFSRAGFRPTGQILMER